MSQTKKANREAYDKKTYKEYKIRVRRDSPLHTQLENHKTQEGQSVNALIVQLLSTHFTAAENGKR